MLARLVQLTVQVLDLRLECRADVRVLRVGLRVRRANHLYLLPRGCVRHAQGRLVGMPGLSLLRGTRSRVNCVPNNFQPSRDPSTGWHRRRR